MTATDITLLASVIAGIFLMIATLIGLVIPLYRRTDQVRDQVAATKDQITNSHETHIRDDIDENTKITQNISDTLDKLVTEAQEDSQRLTDHLVSAGIFQDSTNARLKTIEKWEGRLETIETLIHSN